MNSYWRKFLMGIWIESAAWKVSSSGIIMTVSRKTRFEQNLSRKTYFECFLHSEIWARRINVITCGRHSRGFVRSLQTFKSCHEVSPFVATSENKVSSNHRYSNCVWKCIQSVAQDCKLHWQGKRLSASRFSFSWKEILQSKREKF